VRGVEGATRSDIRVNVVGVNHFTWFTEAKYRNLDLFPVFKEFADKYYETGYEEGKFGNWPTDPFRSAVRVRFDLFRRFGYIAAAGDRHLAEFMDAGDYLASPERVRFWKFGLTPVSWRRGDLERRLAKSQRLYEGTEEFRLKDSGEEGVSQMRALAGIGHMVTNVNLPNIGQIDNLPLGAVVETNALLRSGSARPVTSGSVPDSILYHVKRIADENTLAVEACFSESRAAAFEAFSKGHLISGLTPGQKKGLFDRMFDGTAAYLTMYR